MVHLSCYIINDSKYFLSLYLPFVLVCTLLFQQTHPTAGQPPPDHITWACRWIMAVHVRRLFFPPLQVWCWPPYFLISGFFCCFPGFMLSLRASIWTCLWWGGAEVMVDECLFAFFPYGCLLSQSFPVGGAPLWCVWFILLASFVWMARFRCLLCFSPVPPVSFSLCFFRFSSERHSTSRRQIVLPPPVFFVSILW